MSDGEYSRGDGFDAYSHYTSRWGLPNTVLWPSVLAPKWAVTAATRMAAMGVTIERINEVLKEMREKTTQANHEN